MLKCKMLMKKKIFFKNLFTRDWYFCPRKYFRCDCFCYIGRDEKTHNCFEHFQSRGNLPSEDKTMKITYFYRDLQKYCITFSKYGNFFDFYDPPEVISEFLMLFEQNFVPRGNFEKVMFKGSVTMINRQPPPSVGFLDITNTRVWVTNVYEGIYFNDLTSLVLPMT